MSSQYDLVTSDSQLSHANMLTGIERLCPENLRKDRDYDIKFSYYSKDSEQNGIRQDLEEFRNSNKKSLSLTLIDASLSDQGELQGGSHWTTLHFRKDQEGKINCYYSDSLQSNQVRIPTNVRSAVEASGVSQINGMNCQLQTGNKCGDHSLFNAYAMTQMTEEELNTKNIKRNIEIPKADNFSSKQIMNVENFVDSNRSHLASVFNPISSANSLKRTNRTRLADPHPDQDKKFNEDMKIAIARSLEDQANQSTKSSLQLQNQDRILALELLAKDMQMIKDSKHLNDESKALAISDIEQKNLSLLKGFSDELASKNPNINKKLLKKISSPIVACNSSNFIDELKSLNNSDISNHSKIQQQFYQKFYQTKNLDLFRKYQKNLESPKKSKSLEKRFLKKILNNYSRFLKKASEKSPTLKSLIEFASDKYREYFKDDRTIEQLLSDKQKLLAKHNIFRRSQIDDRPDVAKTIRIDQLKGMDKSVDKSQDQVITKSPLRSILRRPASAETIKPSQLSINSSDIDELKKITEKLAGEKKRRVRFESDVQASKIPNREPGKGR